MEYNIGDEVIYLDISKDGTGNYILTDCIGTITDIKEPWYEIDKKWQLQQDIKYLATPLAKELFT